MQDRQAEPRPSSVDDVAGEPVRAALGMSGDDQLVGAEQVECIGDRLQRVRVSYHALRSYADRLEAVETVAEPRLGGRSGLVLIRKPMSEARPHPKTNV